MPTTEKDNRHTVLIVEDNEINSEILQEMLKEQYDLLLARDGKEGMEQLHAHYSEISVVLLDIQMPVMNGYEVLEAKGKEALLKDIPVIVTTSSKGDDEEIRCLELGAQDFVRKPYFDPLVVRLRVENIIKLRESTEANRQKALFIQKINHEIRTPMNAIIGFTQMLESMGCSMSDEEKQIIFGSILTNSHALLGMIDNMVALSNLDSGKLEVSITDVTPNRVCRDVIKDTAFCAPDGVKVYFTSDVDDTFLVRTDPKYFKLAIYNFLINANKFTSQGEIHLHCSDKEKPGSLIISVTDTGVSIPTDKTDFIFEPFTKLDDFVPGMGLGLTIAQKVATYLGGTAYLDTTYTEGARFILELKLQLL